jgi:hypothetical protein
VQAAGQGEWRTFEDPRGFALEYPAGWDLQAAAPEDGTCPVTALYSWPDWDEPGMFWVEPPDGQRIIEFYAFDNPENLDARGLAARDAGMAGYVLTDGGPLVLDGLSGWEQAWELGVHSGHSLFVAATNRALVVHVYPASAWHAPEVERLLGSLALVTPLVELQPFPKSEGVVPSGGSASTLAQPTMMLPWPGGEIWYFTGGPHDSWTPDIRSGIDFAPGPSRRTTAVAPGEVTFAGYYGGGSGCVVKLRHPNGWNTWYLHLAAWSVEPPDEVGRGADLGTTGGSGGWPLHIHLELLRNDSDHETWHGKIIDSWQVHQDCEGYTGYDPKGGCTTTDYNGYIHHTVSGRQVLPWSPADSYQRVKSNNDPLVEYAKILNNDLPLPGYMLIETTDDRVVEVYLDGELLFEQPANCAYQGWVGPGSHTLSYYSEIRGEGIPFVSVSAWPFEAPVCATEPRDPPRAQAQLTPCTDRAAFVADVTLPRGSIVAPGQMMTKTWRLVNSGTCRWPDYRLEFASGERMGAPAFSKIIPPTEPGEEIEVSVTMSAPLHAGDYTGQWQVMDGNGVWVEGGLLTSKIRVAEASSAIAFYTDPPSPSNAQDVDIAVQVEELEGSRAVRLLVDGEVVAQEEGSQLTYRWDTLAYADGPHSLVVQAATWADPGWLSAAQAGMAYELLPGREAANHAPYPPQLESPANHAVTDTVPALCASPMGDPEGDPVAALEFELEGPVPWTSGWVAMPDTCASPLGLQPGIYTWRARAADEQGRASHWSRWGGFSLVGDAEITAFEFDVPSPSASEQIWIHTEGSGAAGETLVQVNEAADGSTSGDWLTVNYYSGTLVVDSAWDTLDVEDGSHVVRVTIHVNGGTDVEEQIYTLLPRRPSAPEIVVPVQESWVASRTVEFRWDSALRADSYHLVASDEPDPENDATPLLDQMLFGETLSYTHAFEVAYPDIYWSVQASNDLGTSGEGGNNHFGIDEEAPDSSITYLVSGTKGITFTVNWNGTDARSGVGWYEVQIREGERGGWVDWTAQTTGTATTFGGQPGHTYDFRVRATDRAGNRESFPPAGGDMQATLDAASTPEPWWDSGYSYKRGLVVSNPASSAAPSHYPVHLHFDESTLPSSVQFYDASESVVKGSDVRIVYQDELELPRFVQAFMSNTVDIWFPLQTDIGGGLSDRSGYQLYYGNATAGSPPVDLNDVFMPPVDENTVALWQFQEGTGSTVGDSSGHGHDGMFASPGWTANGRFGNAGAFDGVAAEVEIGSDPDLSLVSMTLEAWIYWDGSTGGYVLDKETYWLRVTEGQELEFGVNSGGGDSMVTSTRSLAPGVWTHVAATHDGGGAQRIYVEGRLEGERTDSLAPTVGGAVLKIGAAADSSETGHFSGYIHHVRLSNIARNEFPYAGLAADPDVRAGAQAAPPGSGGPDLTAAALLVYPAHSVRSDWPTVQVVVDNNGAAETRNGFYTDLYAGGRPGGTGDLAGSIGFWVASSVEGGGTLTMTRVLSGTLETGGTMGLQQPGAEASVTLYAQADSEGVVEEPDQQDNISGPVEACIASPDAFEGDDTHDAATALDPRETQAHNLHSLGDEDWFRIEAQGGMVYSARTIGLGPNADTLLSLLDGDGVTLLAFSDDDDSGTGSRLAWETPEDGTYYLRVRHWNPVAAGCGTGYSISLNPRQVYVPMVFSGHAR